MRDSHDYTNYIFLSSQFIWRSLKAMVCVEPEILYLVLILHMVCKLYPSRVTTMKMSLMKFYCHPNVSKKVRRCCMWNLRYQLGSSFCTWSANCTPDKSLTSLMKSFCYPNIWQSLKAMVDVELEIPNLVLILYMVSKL